MIGRTVPVLFEAKNRGYTPNYLEVRVESEELLGGKIESVLLRDCDSKNEYLKAELKRN
jgi:hypothetical protein